jgi:hypothetical protein
MSFALTKFPVDCTGWISSSLHAGGNEVTKGVLAEIYKSVGKDLGELVLSTILGAQPHPLPHKNKDVVTSAVIAHTTLQ